MTPSIPFNQSDTMQPCENFIDTTMPPTRRSAIKFDWTLNLTAALAILMMLVGWIINYASLGTRIAQLESQMAVQQVLNEKYSNVLGRMESTLTRLDTQVTERQRVVDLWQQHSDFRQDKTELRQIK